MVGSRAEASASNGDREASFHSSGAGILGLGASRSYWRGIDPGGELAGLPLHVMPQTESLRQALQSKATSAAGASLAAAAETRHGLVAQSSGGSRLYYGGQPSGSGGLSLACWAGHESMHVAVCAADGGLTSIGFKLDGPKMDPPALAIVDDQASRPSAGAELLGSSSPEPRLHAYLNASSATGAATGGVPAVSGLAEIGSSPYSGVTFSYGKFRVGRRRLKQTEAKSWSSQPRSSSLSTAAEVPLMLAWGTSGGVKVLAIGRTDPLAIITGENLPTKGRRASSLPSAVLPVPSAEALSPWDRAQRRIAVSRAESWNFGPASFFWEDRVVLATRGPCMYTCKLRAHPATATSRVGYSSTGDLNDLSDGSIAVQCMGSSVPASSGTSL